MSSPQSTSQQEKAYVSLMRGLKQLDLTGPSVPCDLVLTGDHAFPLAMTSQGKVLMAASLYGSGRIVVFGHEACLSTQPNLVENAINWLKEGKSPDAAVGVHKHGKKVEENLKSRFKTKLMNDFGNDQGVGVYVTDAYSVAGHEKNIVAFMKSGGGLLIGGQAWQWSSQNPKHNTLLQFAGNRVSGVAGIYFSKHKADAECLPVYPQIPASWMSVVIGQDFEDDLEFLLHGISEFDLKGGVLSEVMIHGSLAFPIGITPDQRCFLAGAYYGQGRVVLISHEGYLQWENFAPFWINALHWLDEGRQGVVGVSPDRSKAFELFKTFDMKCEKTNLRKDLSVFVCTAYKGDNIEELQEFVAEGGGLLIGGHAWGWAQKNKGKNLMTEFVGNKILNKMGISLLEYHVRGGSHKPPIPSQAIKDTYHFRQLLHKFGGHVTKGEKLTDHEEEWLTKLSRDCTAFLHLDANNSNYHQILCSFTEIIKTAGMPQVCKSCPVKTKRDHVLLEVGAELYKVCPHRDELLPHLIKDNPLLPVVYNHRISVNVDTADKEEWVSTGLYLSPGMKTYMSIPADIVDKGWKVQIGCQTDKLRHKELKRAPRVCERFPVTSEMMQVYNLWGGLIYLVAPPNTKASGEVIAQVGVPAPYYKSGVTSLSEWQLLGTAPSPWAELEFENIILTVPSDVVRNLERPDLLAAHWDRIMRAVADLAVIPHKFKRKERFVTDVQISNGFMHCGYPLMAHTGAAEILVKYEEKRSIWGFIHELGHNQQRSCWEFPRHTTECTCNLWSLYVHETVLGFPREECHSAMKPEKRRARKEKYVKDGRQLKDWTALTRAVTKKPMMTLDELQRATAQLVEKFGWDSIKKVFAAYHTMENVPKDNEGKMNLYAVTFSEAVKMDLTGFFKAWGWPIGSDTEKKVSNLTAWNDHPMAEYK